MIEIRSGQRFRVTRGPDGVRVDVLPMRDQHAWVALGMGVFSLAFGLVLLIRGDGRPAPLQEPWRVQGVGTLTLVVGAGLVCAGELRARRSISFGIGQGGLSVTGGPPLTWVKSDIVDLEVRPTGELHVEDFAKTSVEGLFVRSPDGRQALLVRGKDRAALDWLGRVLQTALRGCAPEGGCELCGREAACTDCPDCYTWAPPRS